MARSRKTLRSPFVTTAPILTMALALGGVGCGGRVLSTGASAGDDAGSDSVSPEDDGGSVDAPSKPDADPSCPSSPPQGGACSHEGLSCDYGRCYAPYWEAGSFAYCKGGQWQLGGSSCNPPPPDPPCPTTITAGSACYHPSWKVCQVPDTCPYAPTDYAMDSFQCMNGAWALTGPSYEVPCPAYVPQHGSSCLCGNHLSQKQCYYGDCYGSPTKYAYCGRSDLPGGAPNAWNVLESSCNPPAPSFDGGPPVIDVGIVPSADAGVDAHD